jgi:hypothetical protein
MLFHNVVIAIKECPRDTVDCVVFPDIDSKDGSEIYNALYYPKNKLEGYRFIFTYNSVTRDLLLTMPSFVHEAASSWLSKECSRWGRNLLLPTSFEDEVDLLGSPAFKNFVTPYPSDR